MKKTLILLAIFLVASCATISPEDKIKSDNMAKNGNQHVATGVMLALYYCENAAWPNSLFELKEFSPKNKIELPVQIDWDWLSHPDVVYKVDKSVEFRTPEGNAEVGDVAISSYHNPPVCDGNNVEIKTHINIGA